MAESSLANAACYGGGRPNSGGLIGAFLSHPIFKPLSRLSYCGLLAQTIVLEGYFLSVEVFIDETAIYEGALSDLSWATLLLRLLFWTLVTAFMASLLFESPIIRLLHLYSTAMKAASPEKESPQTSILPKKGTISI
ncbi:hypothetical protein HNY73_002158 [Argiope bruennichi]|uniref:Uncharacterized protein n=1 Tax=Argiope bruennichi TaxID=94029 RepID=A0A8T0FVB7_ARGBR|nr:hypothetical protein HNY73_002158 [Argiope bruennichi]